MSGDVVPPESDPAGRQGPDPASSRQPPITRSSIVYALQFTALTVWIAYSAVYFDSLGIDLAFIGILAAIPSVVAIVAGPAWGLLADRLGDMRPPFLLASAWAAGAALVLALAPAMPWLVVVVVGLAVGTSALTPLLDARTVQMVWPHRERFGQARAWGSVAFIVASVAYGTLVAALGIQALFVVFAAGLLATGVAAYALLGKPVQGVRVAGVGPLAALGLLRMPGMRLFFAGSVLAWTAGATALSLMSLRIVDLGGGSELVGIAWATNALLEIPTMFLFPRLARRVRLEWLVVVGLAIFAVRTSLWSAVTDPLGFVAVAAVSGIGFGLVLVGTTAYVASRMPGHLQATGQALFGATAYSIGTIVGAVLAGQIAQAGGLGAVYPVAAAGAIASVVVVWAAIARQAPLRGGRREPA